MQITMGGIFHAVVVDETGSIEKNGLESLVHVLNQLYLWPTKQMELESERFVSSL